jgi:serine/threonine protein phosphatase 1
MISRLFKSRKKIASPAAPAVSDGVAVWAVGDIHGRLDLLKPLVEAIRADVSATAAKRSVVVFLGDYVDRGPDSRGVIQYLARLPLIDGVDWRFLKGNHEKTMLDFLVDPTVGAQWCEYGGEATLASYGLRLPQMRHKPEGWARLAADLDHKLSAEEREFLEQLELSIEIGDYFFAHAGARPGQTLAQQSANDLLWIRSSFLNSSVEFERVVVHGHTPSAEVHCDHRRVGIDTKAYESGVLTALRLVGRTKSLIQVVDDATGAEARESGPVLVRKPLAMTPPVPA